MSDVQAFAQEVYDRCQQLAQFSQSKRHMDRRYLTTEHFETNLQVSRWMEQAGMFSWQDEAGNIWGRYQSDITEAPTLIIGSHLDTVPNGGIYDGIFGVVAPISVIQYCNENQIRFPFHIDIVGFGDEEGTRFGTTLLGSRAVTGRWQDHWQNLTDEAGISLAEAMEQFKLNIDMVANASRAEHDLLGFFEIHIEQGPVLEAESLPVGIVSSIAGAKRFNIKVTGKAGHSGTVPMAMRQDAMVACAKMVVAIEQLAKEHDVVATVGRLTVQPNAVNVIPGDVDFSLDIRSESDEKRDFALAQIQHSLFEISQSSGVSIEWHQTHAAQATACAPKFQSLLQESIMKEDIEPLTLFSGAGHDAMEVANICPIGMLFMRCSGGISHHPDESISVEDTAVTLKVLYNLLTLLALSPTMSADDT
ncbi:allantoate amidohydrolase [Paraneptunicella aestuarii]|uniref:allantoate amidohydrolase n=1 Tax=Paraneptunicella aestuarii TaxID=2831148 RepID=UPI001E5F9FED|nr:allantoate amidohydrolase [Paraneptunicella aestuarii]UAA37127.1 allantoate amidohydrolase [Paraneptunicella aestuarii]